MSIQYFGIEVMGAPKQIKQKNVSALWGDERVHEKSIKESIKAQDALTQSLRREDLRGVERAVERGASFHLFELECRPSRTQEAWRWQGLDAVWAQAAIHGHWGFWGQLVFVFPEFKGAGAAGAWMNAWEQVMHRSEAKSIDEFVAQVHQVVPKESLEHYTLEHLGDNLWFYPRGDNAWNALERCGWIERLVDETVWRRWCQMGSAGALNAQNFNPAIWSRFLQFSQSKGWFGDEESREDVLESTLSLLRGIKDDVWMREREQLWETLLECAGNWIEQKEQNNRKKLRDRLLDIEKKEPIRCGRANLSSGWVSEVLGASFRDKPLFQEAWGARGNIWLAQKSIEAFGPVEIEHTIFTEIDHPQWIVRKIQELHAAGVSTQTIELRLAGAQASIQRSTLSEQEKQTWGLLLQRARNVAEKKIEIETVKDEDVDFVLSQKTQGVHGKGGDKPLESVEGGDSSTTECAAPSDQPCPRRLVVPHREVFGWEKMWAVLTVKDAAGKGKEMEKAIFLIEKAKEEAKKDPKGAVERWKKALDLVLSLPQGFSKEKTKKAPRSTREKELRAHPFWGIALAAREQAELMAALMSSGAPLSAAPLEGREGKVALGSQTQDKAKKEPARRRGLRV